MVFCCYCKQQVQDLSGLVHSIRCYGIPAAEQQLPRNTLVTLKQELRWLAQDVDSQLQQLGDQAEQLAAEVAADTKAAVAAVEGTVDSNNNSSAVAADGDGRNVTSSSSRGGLRDSSGSDSAAEAPAASPVQERSITVLLQQHPELQQLLSQHPLAPERLKQQVQDAYAGLVQQHRQQVEQLAAQQGAGSSNSSCGKHGCNCMHAAYCKPQRTPRCLFNAHLLLWLLGQ
jgi:hypothetical protein